MEERAKEVAGLWTSPFPSATASATASAANASVATASAAYPGTASAATASAGTASAGTASAATASTTTATALEMSHEWEIKKLKLENAQMRESIEDFRRETEERFQRIEALLLGDPASQQPFQPNQ